MNSRFDIEYVGIDLDESCIRVATERYGNKSNFRAVLESAEVELRKIESADIIVGLETLEHIPERVVVRVIEEVARISPRLFVCSVPVEIGPIIWIKNLGSMLMGYKRVQYSWKETFWAGLYRLDKLVLASW